ncbi:MAG: hypothetical protein QW356_08605 [Candidatus Hadarchaeales archaeon]
MKGETSIEEIRRLANDWHFMAVLRRLLRRLKPITDELRALPELERQAAAIVLMLAIDGEAGGIRLFGEEREFYVG